MKQSKYIIMGCLSLMLGFSSCEMKDELLGEKGQGTEMGTLEVDLSAVYTNGEIVVGRANNTATDNGEINGSFSEEDTNTDNYTLIITNTETQAEVKNDLVKNLKDENGKLSFQLEAGKYNVKAYNYDGADVNVSTRPYFEGTTDFTIEGGKGASVPLTCELACVEVAFHLTEDFNKAFKDDYSIMVNNGDGGNYEFTKDNINTKYYFKTPANKNSLTVSVKATSVEDNPIAMNYTVQKPGDAEGNLANLEGGDAFLINLTEAGATDSYVKKIEISVDLTFTQDGSSFEIPIENITGEDITVNPPSGGGSTEGGDTPSGENTLTVTGIPQTYNLSISDLLSGAAQMPTIEVNISTSLNGSSDGIKSLNVSISSTNETFTNVLLKGMDLDTPFDLCNLEGRQAKTELIGLLLDSSTYEQLHSGTLKSYPFAVTNLVGLLVEQSLIGTHTFNLTISDGKSAKSGALTVVVK